MTTMKHRSMRGSAIAIALGIAMPCDPAASAQQLRYHHEGPSGAYEEFGWSVTSLKDVTGDGMDEYAVGAPFDNGDAGLVTIFDGASGTAIATLTGEPDSLFGWSIADAGDYDGDGIHDLVVGAPEYPGLFGPYVGAVYVYSGDPNVTSFPKLIDSWTGGNLSHLGYSVAGLGDDVDGDGNDDIIVGSPGWNGDAGSVSVYGFSDTFGISLEIWAANGTEAGAQLGYSVASAGNIKHSDGTLDVIVGEPFHDKVVGRVTYADAGAAYALSGIDGAMLYTWEGELDGDRFGHAVDGIGDSTGDLEDFDEVIVGAPYHRVNGIAKGTVVCFTGWDGSELFHFDGSNTDDAFGYAVRGCRVDLGEDGFNDFAVGAPGVWGSSGTGGVVRVYSAFGSLVHEYGTPPEASEPTVFGASIACPDVNGDFQPDMLIGMPGDYWISDIRGSAWVYWVFTDKCVDYGAGHDGTLGVPDCDCIDGADVGGRAQVFISNSLGARTPAILFVGLEAIDVPTNKEGHLLVGDLLFTLPLSIDTAGIYLDGDIPDDPDLGGLSIFLQAIELDPGASKGISFTAGLEMAIGWDY